MPLLRVPTAPSAVASMAAALLIFAAATDLGGIITPASASGINPIAQGIAGLPTEALNRRNTVQSSGGSGVTFEEAAAAKSGKPSIKHIKVKNQNTTVKAKKQAKSTMKLMMEKEVGFLEARRKEQGVRKLPSGLLFKIIKKGKGLKSPNHSDPCELRYTGKLMDGTEFDGSANPNPAVHANKMTGWSEALQMMREGDEWEIYVPHHLAFGADGIEGVVPEYSAVTYRIELVKVAAGGKDAEDNEAVFLRHFGKEYDEL